jgi:hypothetical protein
MASKIEGGFGSGDHSPMNPPVQEHQALEQANTHQGNSSSPKHKGPPNGRGENKREGSH